MLAPAKVLKPGQSSPSFSDKQVELYKKRFVEGYDLHDPQYEMWLKANHLEALSSSDADSLQTHISESVSTQSTSCSSQPSSALIDILVIPKAKDTLNKKRRNLKQCV